MRDFITNLISLRNALNTGSSATVSTVQPSLENSENLLVNALSEHGAIELRIEVNKKQQEVRGQNIETLVAKDADADLASTMVRLSQTNTAYEAALSSATKILQMSLLDFI
jgi:flagellar hook-associated protein 3 FlgL